MCKIVQCKQVMADGKRCPREAARSRRPAGASKPFTGYCILHEQRLENGWRMDRPLRPKRDKNARIDLAFLKSRCKLEPGPLMTPCWIWQRSRSSTGYGTMGLPNGKLQSVHRVAYVLGSGGDLDKPEEWPGMVTHMCDVKLCCNPRHLESGTPRQNIIDKIVRLPPNGKQQKLTPKMVKGIRHWFSEGVTTKEAVEKAKDEMGVDISYCALWNIRRGHTWRHTPESEEWKGTA